MNDKMIINAISKTYFIIISFLSFIFLVLTFLFITFQNGLYLNEFTISNIKIKQLYIKWNEKIDVSVKGVTIVSNNSQTNTSINLKNINQYIQNIAYTTNWFNSIIVEEVIFQKFNGSFKYQYGGDGFISLNSPNFKLETSLSFNTNLLNIHLKKLIDTKRDIDITGDILVNLKNSTLYTKLNMIINHDANLTFYASSNNKQMSYYLQSNSEIKDIKYIVALASLPKEVRFWALDAIDAKSFDINTFKGYLEFDKIDEAYKNIHICATANLLHYTYNLDLDAIHTKTTELEFKNGIFFIRPKNAFSYGMNLGNSWIKIDFTKKEELLTLHLLFDAALNTDILKILNTYKIELPFLQRKGIVSTNLKLLVNLRTIDIDAKGIFYTKKSNFDYLGLNIDIFDAKIELNNYNVQIENMKASYKDIAKANVNVYFDAKDSVGTIDLNFNEIKLKGVSLDTDKTELAVSYIILPSHDIINVEHSTWNINNKKISVDPISMQFDLKTLNLDIPTTYIDMKNIGALFISGLVNVKSLKSKISIDLLNLSYDGVSLSQSNTPLLLEYEKKLSITSSDKIFFNVSGTAYELDKLKLVLDENDLILKTTEVSIGKYTNTKISAKYDLKSKHTHVSLSDFTIMNITKNKIFYKNKKIMLSIENLKNSMRVSSKELDSYLISNNEGWELKVNSIGRISKSSQLLKQFNLNKGDFTLSKKNNEKYVKFSSNLIYPYKILTDKGVPTSNYNIAGSIKNDKVYLTINNNTKIKIANEIKIYTSDTGINIDELLRLIKETKKSDTQEKTTLIFNAKKSYLYLSQDRTVISDTIDLQYKDDILTAQLQHATGNAGLRFEDDNFHLYGKNFNNIFMENLFSLSKFDGGKLDFSMAGKVDDYSGVFYIVKSTIKDYKVLNNILAFINTVPSLFTFSLPGYSNNGLFIQKAYINFNSKKNLFHLSDIYLKSKELTILGNGNANIVDDTVDIDLNLKTDLGSNASKIPLVGYIIFDKETVSTTLEINGKLSDPDIKSLIARDIAVAPLNIIKRTIMLPYNAIKNLTDNNESK